MQPAMDLVPIKIEHGERAAWESVCGLSREDVCARTGATFDEGAGAYLLRCFGIDFLVNPCDERIEAPPGPGAAYFLGRLRDFFRLAVLHYLSNAKDIPPTGRLLRPIDIKGGHRFTTGTHVLPLEAIAARYAGDREAFLARGRAFGAEEVPGTGDACIRLFPLPRVPVTMILWLAEEEFPPRVDLLFDSTCEFQISLSDIIWAIAMMSCLVMLDDLP